MRISDWSSDVCSSDLEIEGSAGELEPVAVRRWRDASSSSEKSLACTSRAMISRSLRAVAAWSHLHRAHFEWVWDGDNVWIVQLDFLAPRTNGVQPDSLRSEEHTSDLQSLMRISYAVFCLKKKHI